MEVLESITNYVENIKGHEYLYKDQREALEILYEYCNNTEPNMNICEIDSSFFDEFLIYCYLKTKVD